LKDSSLARDGNEAGQVQVVILVMATRRGRYRYKLKMKKWEHLKIRTKVLSWYIYISNKHSSKCILMVADVYGYG